MNLSKEDILKSKAVYLYNEDTVYVEIAEDEVYGLYKNKCLWYKKNNFYDYFESSLMMSFFTSITKEEATNIIEKWIEELETANSRSIATLLKKYDELWFYISDDYKEIFHKEIVALNAKFISGNDVDIKDIQTLMGINKGKEVGYISNLVWYNSFNSTKSEIIKVNYEKYHEGNDEYQIVKPNIMPIDFNEFAND